jgi:hypothetical protein
MLYVEFNLYEVTNRKSKIKSLLEMLLLTRPPYVPIQPSIGASELRWISYHTLHC